ncbi:hypothetical protein ACA373_05680 [Erwinia sp. STN24]|uniref:hypothetical protein n=1 Tax=Erwinia sp. STN24 TaxID=3233996 RepID=UPI00351FD89D
MGKNNRLTLKLDGTSPDQLPMARLSKYLSALSDLYGSVDAVHFKEVSEGSACLNTWVDSDTAYNQVVERSLLQAKNNGKHYQKLVSLLAQDGYRGSIINSDELTIVNFPVADEAPLFSVKKRAKVQGRLYNVGGKDESAPVKLEGANGETYNCEATPAMAAKLGSVLFKQIRVEGDSEWEKKDGIWKLKKLKISSFDVLDKSSLRSALASLNEATGNAWKEEDNPHVVLKALREFNCE